MTRNCENGKYLASITDNSGVICVEVTESFNEEAKAVPTNFNEKNITYKKQNFYSLLAFFKLLYHFS